MVGVWWVCGGCVEGRWWVCGGCVVSVVAASILLPVCNVFVFVLLFLHPCCFHARGILFRIHILCMGSPFPAVQTSLH